MNDIASTVGLLRRATSLLPQDRRRGELLWELSVGLRAAGAAEEAAEALRGAEADARALHDRGLRARVSAEAAWVRLVAGQMALDEAMTAVGGAVTELERAKDERGLGRALLAAAAVHLFGCNYTELEGAAADAAAHYAHAGVSPAACLGAQAEAIYLGPTPVPEAKARCAELLDAAPDRVTAAVVSAALGALHALAGDIAEGRSLVADARAVYDDVGSSFGATTTLVPLELGLELCAGELERAEAIARESLGQLQAGGATNRAYSTSRALELASLLLDAGRTEEAEPLVEFGAAEAVGSDVYAQILWRSARARILARTGEPDHAASLARQATAIAAHTDALVHRARTHLALAEVQACAGRSTEERRERDEALRLLRAKGATALVPMARAASLAS
jgi:hypothetical protein